MMVCVSVCLSVCVGVCGCVNKILCADSVTHQMTKKRKHKKNIY